MNLHGFLAKEISGKSSEEPACGFNLNATIMVGEWGLVFVGACTVGRLSDVSSTSQSLSSTYRTRGRRAGSGGSCRFLNERQGIFPLASLLAS